MSRTQVRPRPCSSRVRPSPHLVIGDVGCTVACGASLHPLPLALEPIEALWRGRAEKVLPLLARDHGIRLLEVSPTDESLESVFAYLVSA